MELKDYLHIIRRRWLQIVAIFTLVAFAQLFFIYAKPQIYTAASQILFKQSPYELGYIVPEEYPYQVVPVESRITLLTSQSVCKIASEKIKKDINYTISPDELRSTITTVQDPKIKDVVTMQVTYTIPEIATSIANTLITSYLEYDVESSRKNIDKAHEFLVMRKIDLASALEIYTVELRQKITTEMVQKGVWDPETQATIKAQQLIDLEKTRQTTKLDIVKIATQIKAMPDVPPSPIIPVPVTPETTTLLSQLDTLKIRLSTLRKRYKDEHPNIIDIKQEIQDMSNLAMEIASRLPAEKVLYLKEQKELLETTDKFLEEVITREWSNLFDITEKKAEFQDNRKRIDDLQARLTKVQDKLDNLELLQKTRTAEKETGIEILARAEKAVPIPKAEKASLPIILLISLVIGLASGYLIEYLNDMIRNPYDVKAYLNLPTITSIPQLKDEKLILLDVAIKSPVHELYNKLAIFIEQVSIEQKVKTLLLTSAKAKEGKSTVSTNLAIALAQSGKKVILVDSDLRRPQCHMIFGLDNSKGFANILSGELEAEQKLSGVLRNLKNGGELEAEQKLNGVLKNGEKVAIESYLQPTSVETLKVLTSGPLPMNPINFLKSDKMKETLSDLRKLADIVIFDSPPLLGVIDAAIIAGLADATIIVLAENFTRRSECAQLKHSLTQVDANILGVIINKASYQPETYYYYYHRYRGYSA